jgi:anti-sigma regulatory factor (Ser/Thr protein kinase)
MAELPPNVRLSLATPMAELPPNVRLSLAGTAENVVLVRGMLSGVAEATALGGSDLNDIRIAVTEACNNVVMHAYEGEQGPLEVDVCIAQDTLGVLVRDRGSGIQTQPDAADATTTGIGLHVIRTLTRKVELEDASGGGTEVRMEFAAPGVRVLEPSPEDGVGPPILALTGSTTATTVSIAPMGLARTILPRVVSALAARAHFSTDRISDAQLLADALVAHAHRAISGDHLSIRVSVEPRDLELCIAPLRVGRAQRLIGDSEVDGLGRVIEKLTDRYRVTAVDSDEVLNLHLLDRR